MKRRLAVAAVLSGATVLTTLIAATPAQARTYLPVYRYGHCWVQEQGQGGRLIDFGETSAQECYLLAKEGTLETIDQPTPW
ncbi:MAG: hypothetical protein QM595_15030 [Nocardioides sp.]